VAALRAAGRALHAAADRFGEATAIVNLGYALWETGQPAQCRECWRLAATLFGQIGAVDQVVHLGRLLDTATPTRPGTEPRAFWTAELPPSMRYVAPDRTPPR
jgi:hypothetical protein